MGNVILLGLVSFFSDISSEMVYPLIPLYLISAFGATPVLVGIIEGIAESIASLLKVYSGYISDKYKRKKILAFGGYSTGIIYKVALLIASSWTGILFARAIDRMLSGPCISEISPVCLKGTMLGLQATIVGLSLLPASVIAGLLWNAYGAQAPFVFGAVLSLLAAFLLIILMNRNHKQPLKN